MEGDNSQARRDAASGDAAHPLIVCSGPACCETVKGQGDQVSECGISLAVIVRAAGGGGPATEQPRFPKQSGHVKRGCRPPRNSPGREKRRLPTWAAGDRQLIVHSARIGLRGKEKGGSGSEEKGSPRGGGASVWKDKETDGPEITYGTWTAKRFALLVCRSPNDTRLPGETQQLVGGGASNPMGWLGLLSGSHQCEL